MLNTSTRTLHGSERQVGRGGFTLPELLIVISMISIMLAIAGPKITATMTQATVRSASMEVGKRIAIARQAAVRRGRTSTFNMNAAHTKAWVNVTKGDGTILLLGDTLFIEEKYGVAATATVNQISYDARGFASLAAQQTFAVTKDDVTKSVCVTAAGFILNGCTL
jgi:prepilin-type N-terminal cleavage/methylation domain-containing protein